jgi:predicted nucleic acid-binding protein
MERPTRRWPRLPKQVARGVVAALFDTNILIDCLNGYGAARKCMRQYPDRAISVITFVEIIAGAKPTDEVAVRSLFGGFELIHTDNKIAELAGELRKSYRLKLPDALIVATAQASRRTLITRDVRIVNGDLGVACVRPYVI